MATGGIPALIGISSAVFGLISVQIGNYNFAGASSYGRFPTPPQVPFLALDVLGVESEDDSAPLGTYEHTASFFIEAWGSSSSTAPTGVVSANLLLSQAIQAAIHDSFLIAGGSLRALGVRRCNFTDTEFMSTEINNVRIGHVRMTLEITYTTIGGI